MRHHQTPTSIGRYQILRQIGEGGMGEVFLAQDPHIDRPLAIKTVRLSGASRDAEEHKQRLLREARAAGRLIHPNVVTLFDADEIDGMLFLAFEFVDGPDLGRRLAEPPPLSLGQVLHLLTEVASALEYAHHEGIIHRDIKPSNILIGSRGQAKVADFGLAKLKDESVELTRTGSVVGSPQYMSPEQVRGEALDGRTDIFSLGVLAYELLTRLRPFGGQTISTLVFEILSKEPVSIGQLRPGLPPRLTALVHRMLAKDASYRAATAREVIDEIGQVVGETPQEALDAPAVPTVDDAAPTARLGGPPPIPPPPSSPGGGVPPTVVAPIASFSPPPGERPVSGSSMVPPPPPSAVAQQPSVPIRPPLPADAIASQPVGTGTYATRGSRSWGLVLGLALGLLALLSVAGGAWWLGSRGRSDQMAESVQNGSSPPLAGLPTAGNPDPDTSALADDGEFAAIPAATSNAISDDPPPSASAPGSGSMVLEEPPVGRGPQDDPSAGPSQSLAEPPSPPPRAPPPPPPPSRAPSPSPSVDTSRSSPPPLATEVPEPRQTPAPAPPRSPAEVPGTAPWLGEFDTLAAAASQQITSGRWLHFDIEPATAIVRVWRRGDRRQRVMGQAEDYASRGKNTRPLELPESGEYLLTLVVGGYPDLVIRAEVDERGSEPRVIHHRFTAAATAGTDRVRVSRAISFDGTPADAQVVIDGISRGVASRWPGGIRLAGPKNLKLRPGIHTISIEAPGYEPFRIEVEVSPNASRKSQTIQYTLRR